MNSQTQDPAVQWADLLQELNARRREAAVSALRQSVTSGSPVSRDGVITLIAYAQGRISSRDYAAQTLVTLGLADAHSAPELLRAASAPTARPAPRYGSTDEHPLRPGSMDANAGAEFLSDRPYDEFWQD